MKPFWGVTSHAPVHRAYSRRSTINKSPNRCDQQKKSTYHNCLIRFRVDTQPDDRSVLSITEDDADERLISWTKRISTNAPQPPTKASSPQTSENAIAVEALRKDKVTAHGNYQFCYRIMGPRGLKLNGASPIWPCHIWLWPRRGPNKKCHCQLQFRCDVCQKDEVFQGLLRQRWRATNLGVCRCPVQFGYDARNG